MRRGRCRAGWSYGSKPLPNPEAEPGSARWQSEAAWLLERGGSYFLMVNHGDCCKGMRSNYNIVMGRSANASGPFVDRAGKRLLVGGGSELADYDTHPPFHGPGHFGLCEGCGDDGEDVVSFHYDSAALGYDTAALHALVWGADGWPSIAWG